MKSIKEWNGYIPEKEFKDGIKKLIKWYKEYYKFILISDKRTFCLLFLNLLFTDKLVFLENIVKQ